MGRDTPMPGSHRSKRHRKHPNSLERALCGRRNCALFPEGTFPDSQITCPDCQRLIRERKQAA